MRLVFAANIQTGPRGSSDEFCKAHPELLSKHDLRSFYSRDRIMTMQEKVEFVEPGLQPLPPIVDDAQAEGQHSDAKGSETTK